MFHGLYSLCLFVLLQLFKDKRKPNAHEIEYIRSCSQLIEVIYDPYLTWRNFLHGHFADHRHIHATIVQLHVELVPFIYGSYIFLPINSVRSDRVEQHAHSFLLHNFLYYRLLSIRIHHSFARHRSSPSSYARCNRIGLTGTILLFLLSVILLLLLLLLRFFCALLRLHTSRIVVYLRFDSNFMFVIDFLRD